MVHLVCYADDRMTRAQRLCIDSSLKYGVENYAAYTKQDLYDDKFFYESNRQIIDSERGSGYWLFKPYIIMRSLLSLKDGDILIYADAGVEFVAPVQEIINRMDEDIFFFTNGWPHAEWCKMDVLDGVLRTEEWGELKFEMFAKSVKQVQASVIFFKVNQKTRDFVKEWLLWCQMLGFIDDSPSKLPNYPTFAEHRHDQAILTCVAIKHGYTIDHWWPTQYSMHLPRSERDSYPVMFIHHRKRNWEW